MPPLRKVIGRRNNRKRRARAMPTRALESQRGYNPNNKKTYRRGGNGGGSRNCAQAPNPLACNNLSSCSWCEPERRCKPIGQCGVPSGTGE